MCSRNTTSLKPLFLSKMVHPALQAKGSVMNYSWSKKATLMSHSSTTHWKWVVEFHTVPSALSRVSNKFNEPSSLPLLHTEFISMRRSPGLFPTALLLAHLGAGWRAAHIYHYLPVSVRSVSYSQGGHNEVNRTNRHVHICGSWTDLSHSAMFPLDIRCPASKFSPRDEGDSSSPILGESHKSSQEITGKRE